MDGFYDDLAPFYHLIFPDWDASITAQASALDGIIRTELGDSARRVLDVSCGIGTQSLGLARFGYEVTASDLSPRAVERARREAASRHLAIHFSVADMRAAFDHHRDRFDVVISCDNSVPHLLTDDDIRAAFAQFYRSTRPGGLCLISVRDYAAMPSRGLQVNPHGVRREGNTRFVLFQVWEFQGEIYETTMYIVEDDGSGECRTRAFRAHYHAVTIDRLESLLRDAGFDEVRRIDDRYFQPLILGRRPEASGADA